MSADTFFFSQSISIHSVSCRLSQHKNENEFRCAATFEYITTSAKNESFIFRCCCCLFVVVPLKPSVESNCYVLLFLLWFRLSSETSVKLKAKLPKYLKDVVYYCDYVMHNDTTENVTIAFAFVPAEDNGTNNSI